MDPRPCINWIWPLVTYTCKTHRVVMGVSAQSDTTYDLHIQVFSGLESGTWVAPLPPQILSANSRNKTFSIK